MEARVDPETDRRLTEAAALTRESVSAFIVRASRVEADRVLARGDTTLMPAAQFDELIAALDRVEPAPTLARAAARAAARAEE